MVRHPAHSAAPRTPSNDVVRCEVVGCATTARTGAGAGTAVGNEAETGTGAGTAVGNEAETGTGVEAGTGAVTEVGTGIETGTGTNSRRN